MYSVLSEYVAYSVDSFFYHQFFKPCFYLLYEFDVFLCSVLSDGETGIQGHSPAAQRPGLGTDAGRGED